MTGIKADTKRHYILTKNTADNHKDIIIKIVYNKRDINMKKALLIIAVLIFTSAASIYGQGYEDDSASGNYALALKASTLGVSFDVIRSFNENLNLRLGGAYFTYQQSGGGDADEDYEYDGDLNLLSFNVLLDWFPFSNYFRITGGALINLNEGEITMIPTKEYKVGNITYDKNNLGTMTAEVDVNKVAPFLSIGFDNPAAGGKGIGFTFDAGVIYQGAPNVDLIADGLLEPSTEQAPKIEDNLNWFQFYPVVSVGLTYTF